MHCVGASDTPFYFSTEHYLLVCVVCVLDDLEGYSSVEERSVYGVENQHVSGM